MATEKISLQYDLRQNASTGGKASDKWYPQVVRRDTLSLRGLADHISDHGSVYTRDVVLGVLTKFTSCLVELVSQGVAVKIDGLGTFYPTMESEGAETPVDYNILNYLLGVHIRFYPENSQLDKITSRAFKEKCTLKQRLLIDKEGIPRKVVNGKVVPYGDNGSDDDDTNNGGDDGDNNG